MGSRFSAISALSGAKTGPDTSIKNFSSNVRYSPTGIQMENVDLVLPAIGTVTGSGTVSPQDALDYKMDATLNGSTVSGVTKLVGVSSKSASIPFFVQGTASDPKFVPDVKGMVSGMGKGLESEIPGGKNTQGIVNSIGGLFGKKKK